MKSIDIEKNHKNFLISFKQNYPCKELEIKDKKWLYVDSGTNGPLLVLLHGGFSNSYFFFHQIPLFEKKYNIIAPTIPEGLNNLKDIVESLKELIILENKNKSPISFLGISFGGIIAQVFLHHYPKMLDKVILSHTGIPQNWRQKKFLFMYCIYKILPYSLIRRFAKKIAIKKDSTITSKWTIANSQYFAELGEDYLSKKLFLSRFQGILDFKKYELDPLIMKKWNGKILILASEDDRLVYQVPLMKSYYKEAIVHVFQKGKGGHHTNLYFPEDYNTRVKTFLEKNK